MARKQKSLNQETIDFMNAMNAEYIQVAAMNALAGVLAKTIRREVFFQNEEERKSLEFAVCSKK